MAVKPKAAITEGEKVRAIQVILNGEGGAILDRVQQLMTEHSTDEGRIPKVRIISMALAFLDSHLRRSRKSIRSTVAEVKQIARRSGIAGVAQGRTLRCKTNKTGQNMKEVDEGGLFPEATAAPGEEPAA